MVVLAAPQRCQKESKKAFKAKKKWGGAGFSRSRAGRTANTHLVKVGRRGFVRKHMQALLSQCEREKLLMRRMRRAGGRGGQRQLLNVPFLLSFFCWVAFDASIGGNDWLYPVHIYHLCVWNIRARRRENLHTVEEEQAVVQTTVSFSVKWTFVRLQSSLNTVHQARPPCRLTLLPLNSSDGGQTAHTLTIFNKTTSY